jgi:hypothetical protein
VGLPILEKYVTQSSVGLPILEKYITQSSKQC